VCAPSGLAAANDISSE